MSNQITDAREPLLDGQIAALMAGAEKRGERYMVRICTRALAGHVGARALCAAIVDKCAASSVALDA